jgi:NAD(P)H-dependent flavin oxidoreductase YrpB (nitropropane dioxygenase family)
MGTRFIASVEAYGHDAYKHQVVDGRSKDTTLSKAYTGKPLRTLQNKWTAEWAHRTDEIEPFPAQYAVAGTRVESGYQDGDVDYGMLPAGQGIENVHAIRPAADIVREIGDEADRIVRYLMS